MKVKRFFSATMQDALRLVRESLGPEAVILSNSQLEDGIEIVAALDYEEGLLEQQGDEAVDGQKSIPRGKPNPSQLARMHAEKHIMLRTEMENAKRRIEGVRRKGKNSDLKAPLKGDHSEGQLKQSELSDMRAQIKELKSMLVDDNSAAKNSAVGPTSYTLVQKQVSQTLASLRLSQSIRKTLIDSVKNQVDYDLAWKSVCKQIEGSVVVEDVEIIDQGGVVALVGPTGSGKTMTIGKMAAQYVMRYGADSIALVTTDRYRIAAHEQLKVFGRILNVPVHTVDDSNSLDAILKGLSSKKLVLIDTAGLMYSDTCWAEQLQELKLSASEIKNYLLVSAVGQYQVMCSSYNNYKVVGLEGVIITKVDEAVSLGEVLSLLIDTRLRTSYFTNGQRVPEDIHTMKKDILLPMAEGLLNSSERWVTIRSADGELADDLAFSHSA